MTVKEVIVLLSAMTVAGCANPAHYSTPAFDPDEVSLATGDQAPDPVPHKQAVER